MKIGELADRTGVTTKTVRYYESIGLLAEPERTASGYRDYDTDAVERLCFVRDAQATGLSLAEIASVLELKAAGSTSCSVKVFRYQILYQALNVQMVRLMRPHAVAVPRYNGRPIPESVTDSVFAFFFLFLLLFALLAFGLSALGLDFVTAVSSAATAIANVGPGLGDVVGPTGTFASLPDAAKWLMAAGMLLGRLEAFTVLVLLSPAFWRA